MVLAPLPLLDSVLALSIFVKSLLLEMSLLQLVSALQLARCAVIRSPLRRKLDYSIIENLRHSRSDLRPRLGVHAEDETQNSAGIDY